jgi:hypothetical protein
VLVAKEDFEFNQTNILIGLEPIVISSAVVGRKRRSLSASSKESKESSYSSEHSYYFVVGKEERVNERSYTA